MTSLGAALNILIVFRTGVALRLPNSDPEMIAWNSDEVIDYDGEPDDVSLWDYEYQTRSPSGWRVKPGNMTSLGIMHIPKTAGTSFTLDAPRYLPSGAGLYSMEASLHGLEKVVGIGQIVTFVRHPTGHVYSQFLELADDDKWGKEILKDRSKVKDVTTWLEQFFLSENIETNDPGGYHPFNMQARSFTNTGNDNHHYHIVDTEQAISNMKKIKFVGITEYYHESMCLFFDKVQPAAAMPKWCDCKSPEWSQFTCTHESHNVRKHSLKDLSERDLGMIAKLTQKDEALYKESLNRFFHEIDEFENRKQMKLSCAWKR